MRKPQWPHFSSEIIERLAHAIDIDDDIEPDVSLPEQVRNQAGDDDMQQCYALCLRYWEQGVSRKELLALVNGMLTGPMPSADDMRRFKQIRARFKHLRFAQRLFCADHKAIRLFGWMTSTMGKLQDAYKNGQQRQLHVLAWRLRAMLCWPAWAYIHCLITFASIGTSANVWAYRLERLSWLKQVASQRNLGGKSFHDTRKVISQQVAYYDTYRTLNPDDAVAYQISRFLAAINGMMGNRHDEIVADSMAGERRYDDPVEVNDDLSWRLKAVIKSFGL